MKYAEALRVARQLPKAELHMHLDGSLLPSFLFRRATARNCREELPGSTAELRTMIDDMKREMRRGPRAGHQGIASGKNWPIFDLMNRFLQTSDELCEASFELATFLARQHNVRYLELRFCPLLHTLEGLSAEEACRAVLRGLSEAFASRETAGGAPMRGGVILCGLRSHPSPQPLEVARLAARLLQRDGGAGAPVGVVGFDIAGSEEFPLRLPAIQEALAFCRASGVPVTVHAGEIPGGGSAANLKDALDLPVRRIGHGAALVIGKKGSADEKGEEEEEEEGPLSCSTLLKRAAAQGTVVEVCLTAIATASKGVPSIASHPIRALVGAGVPVALSCDNLLLSGDPTTAAPPDHGGGGCVLQRPEGVRGNGQQGKDSGQRHRSRDHRARILDDGGEDEDGEDGEDEDGGEDEDCGLDVADRGFAYAHPSGEVAHLVATLGFSWAEARGVVRDGVRRGAFLELDEEFLLAFERDLDRALMPLLSPAPEEIEAIEQGGGSGGSGGGGGGDDDDDDDESSGGIGGALGGLGGAPPAAPLRDDSPPAKRRSHPGGGARLGGQSMYFHPKQWSRRYPPSFFTAKLGLPSAAMHNAVAITGGLASGGLAGGGGGGGAAFEVREERLCGVFPRRYAAFYISCASGDTTWVVKRRMSEWLALWASIRGSIDGRKNRPCPPPREFLWFRDTSPAFLERRAAILTTFLDDIMQQAWQADNSAAGEALKGPIAKFLED